MKSLLAVAFGLISCGALFLAWKSAPAEASVVDVRLPDKVEEPLEAGATDTVPASRRVQAADESSSPAHSPPAAAPLGLGPSVDSGRLARFTALEEEGPMLRAYYADGTPEYLGQQVQRPDGNWVRDGPWQAWHENGELHELGAYKDGVEEGVWKWWYDNGSRMSVGYFENGLRHGDWDFWHENGARFMDATYRNGKGDGRWVSYHENGVKHAEGDYVDGEIRGRWTMWHDDGSVDHERSGLYEGGEKVSD